MPKKDTKPVQLSEKIHITVEEMKNLGVDNPDHMFIEIYTRHARQLTDTRQQEKVKHSLRDVVGIVFFAVLAGNDEWTEIADFAVDEEETNCPMESPPMIRSGVSFLSCAPMSCRICWQPYWYSL